MTLHVRGIVLPDRQEREFWIDGDLLRTQPPGHADSETVIDGGWLLPGLVDVHTHPGAEKPGDPFDEQLLRQHLGDQADAGVLLIRAPGSAARIPDWAYDATLALPRIQSAGPWLATPGRFFPDWGRHIETDELVDAAVEEARASTGWCKIIGDWAFDGEPVPVEVLREATRAVHAAGGKVAVHCQTAAGCHNAVHAQVDSLEHGIHLDPDLLGQMAAQGTALVPTLTVFGPQADSYAAQAPSPRRAAVLRGWAAALPTARAAYEAGVTVLAGTDSVPHGAVASEVDWLIRAGLPVEAALGAASWTARQWLGLPGLTDGAPADLVAYDTDPAADPAVIRHPSRVILRGRVIS